MRSLRERFLRRGRAASTPSGPAGSGRSARTADTSAGAGGSGDPPEATGQGEPDPPPATDPAVLAAVLRRAAALPDAADPLAAELAVSRALADMAPTVTSDVDRPAAQAELVRYLADHQDRAALALLRAAAQTGGPSERAAARAAADTLAAQQVAEPRWFGRLDHLTVGRCLVYGDIFGDQESWVCTFSYTERAGEATGDDPGGDESSGLDAGESSDVEVPEHALVVLVDHNLGGIVKDIFCSAQASRTLRAIELAHAEDGTLSVLEPVAPASARAALERAFTATCNSLQPPLGEGALRLWSFARARAATLAEPPRALDRASHDNPARAALVTEFLDSSEAADLSNRDVATGCARTIVDHGCDYDEGRPLRVSPAKTELFLLFWLPRQPGLSRPQIIAMPAVMEAWVRWAGTRQGLPGRALAEVVTAVQECGQELPSAYRDGTTGL